MTGVVERITGWDRKVRGVSLVPAALSIASVGVALSLAAGARAQEQNLSKFKFTADNQAQIFLNGELLGTTNQNWKNVNEASGTTFLEGINVLAIAAWDVGQIAGINGTFEFSGTEKPFGTSSDGWLSYVADEVIDGTKNYIAYSYTQQPFEDFADLLNVPDGWNQANFVPPSNWTKPGQNTKDNGSYYAWGSAQPTGDLTWIWPGIPSTKNSNWDADNFKFNFALFRYEFACYSDICKPVDEWGDLKYIEGPLDSSWKDIITTFNLGSTNQTLPHFKGGTLSFEGFDVPGREFAADFYVDSFDENTIDSKDQYVKLTGDFVGPGGLTFKGTKDIVLSGVNSYEGVTRIQTSNDAALVIADKKATPKGETVVSKGAILRFSGNEIKSKGEITLEEGSKIGFWGELTALNGNIKLEGGQSKIYVNENLPRASRNDEGAYIRPQINGIISGSGGITKVGDGSLTLTGVNTYTGKTKILKGQIEVIGSLSPETDVEVAKDAAYNVLSSDAINSLSGEGKVSLERGSVLSVGSGEFSGRISGDGSLAKSDDKMLTLSGNNNYSGRTSIEVGILKVTGSLSDSTSVTVLDGAVYKVANSDEIGSLEGAGDVQIFDNQVLTAGSLDKDTTFSGVMRDGGGFTKVGSSIITFSGINTHSGDTTVDAGTLLAGADGTFSKSSELIANEGGMIDLGGFNQSVEKISIKGGELKNGFLSGGTVEVLGTGFIDGVGAVAEESESESKLETDPEVEAIVISPGSASLVANGLKSGGYLTLTGDNHFKDLSLVNGKVLLGSVDKPISEPSSLLLDNGVSGSAYRDALVLQGALTLDEDQTIDLGGGDDLFLIGENGSLIVNSLEDVEPEAELAEPELAEPEQGEAEKEEIKKLKITIDGGPGDMDIFWDASGNYYALTESADGLFTESDESQLAGNVKNFELVGVAGQGIAYFGETPSFATLQTEGSPPAGEYGLVLGSVGEETTPVNQKLTINSDYDSGSSNSLTTIVSGIALGKGEATIVVPGGTLEAGIIYGEGAASKNTIELGSSFTGEVKRGSLGSVAKGRLDVGVLYGYDTINQLGGMWSYDGRMDETNLLAQGVVRVQPDDSATFKSITARERSDKPESLSPFGVKGRAVIAVSGELTIGEGGIREQGSARASLLVASDNGDDAHVDLKGESNYSGPTIVGRGGSLHAHTENALSSVSKTLVGNEASILIEGKQAINRLLIREDGQFSGGVDSELTTKSILNRGNINLDSLVIEDGMIRFIDRYIKLKDAKGEPVPDDSLLRKIDAQGSLKNIGGSISLTGDLTFKSTGEAGGHALLNLSTGGRGVLEESDALISANSIKFSNKNDVLINSGFIDTTGPQGIDFGGGNDLVLTKGTFSIEGGSKIDGGEPLDITKWGSDRLITGFNIFKAYEDPGVVESDLVNWAAIKLGSDQDWLFPQGGECRVTGEGNVYSNDTVCVGLTGQKQDQFVQIDSDATLDAGVIALGRGSSNTIEVRNGNLHAILIEGSPGQTTEEKKDRLFLGDGSGGSGELIVGAITGFDSMEQRGGTWSYAVNGVDDPQVKDRLITSGRRTAEELDEMGSFPAFTGYGIAKIAPVEITGRDRKQRTVQRAAFARIEGTNLEKRLFVQNIDSELEVTEGIHGNASLTTSGNTLLKGESSYFRATTIQSGGELKAGNSLALSPSSEITVEPGGVLDLDGFANRILGLSGGSRAVSDPGIVKLGTNCSEDGVCDQELSGGILSVALGDFNGTIEDVADSSGALIKVGSPDDILTLGGVNQYLSPTLIQGGILKASADQALSPNSPHSLIGGELDLRGYQQVLPSVNIAGGVLRVESDNPVSVAGNVNFADGRIVAYLNNGTAADGANAPISAQTFNYIPLSQTRDPNHGIYAIVDPAGTSNPELNGTWKVIAGEVNDIDALARKTFLIFPVTEGQEVDSDQVIEVDGVLYSVANFAGLDTPLDAASLKDIVLEEGSLNIVVKDKSKEEIIEDIDEDEKLGCDGLQELCDGLKEPEVDNLLDLVLPIDGETGLAQKLPVLQWGQLAKLLGSGLTPRNVDAAPRGMQTYNNILVDTIFERHPLRQFRKLEMSASSPQATPSDLEVVPSKEPEPVRGLWMKDGSVSDDHAQEYLGQAVQEPSAADEVLASLDPLREHIIAFDGDQYIENPSLAAQYAERDGVRGWFRGFGANNRSYSSTTLNNDYSLYTGGFAIGADVSLGESFQLGAYANYGDVNVVQGGVTGGGSWNPDGWGGGVSADYWTENFYVQGLLGATGYSASQSRGIANLEKEWGGDTATANKNANSYVGALRIGAPFESGSLLLEPQFTGIWTQNHENSFSESGVRDGLRLRYGSRTTNYLQTGLGMKFAWPIDSGGRNQFVPSLKVAWLADWDLGNDGQSIGYKFTDREVKFEPKQETQNGALIEVGLDYTIANINKMSVKLYANGGAELWGGDRGTTWRGSGGVTFQF